MPTSYINSITDLRKGLGDAAKDYSDEELVKALADSTGMHPEDAATKFGYDTAKGPWTEKLSSSVDSYQAGLYRFGGKLSNAVGLNSLGQAMGRRERANTISSDISSARAAAGGIPDSYEDVDSVGSAARYVGGLAVSSLPYALEAAAGGIAGRVVMGGAMGAEALAALSTSERGRLLTRAGLAGGTAASYPSSVGDILGNQEEQSGKTDMLSAAALGVPYAAFNALGESRLAATLHGPKSGVQALDRMTGFKGGAARAAATAGRLGVEEGIGETGQEVMNQMGRMAVDPNATLTSPDALKRYAESGVGGFALGGALGGGLGGWRRSHAQGADSSSPMAPVTPDDTGPNGPVDLLRQPLGIDRQIAYDPTSGKPVMYSFPDGSTGTEAEAFAHRYAPQQADAGPINLLTYDPNVGKPTYFGVQNGQTVATSGDDAFNARFQPQPAGPVAADQAAPVATPVQGPQTPAGVVQRSQIQPVEQAPAIQTEEKKQTDNEAPPVDAGPPASPGGIAQMEQTKARVASAKEAIGRAQEAGMTSEKQQTGFWRAEQLASDGKLDESKMTQVVALLTQSMYGKATKIMDEAATGVGHDDLQAKFKAIDGSQAEADKHLGDVASITAEGASLRDQLVAANGTKPDPAKPGDKVKAVTKLKQAIAKNDTKLAAAQAKASAAVDHVKQLQAQPGSQADAPAAVAPIAVRDTAAPAVPTTPAVAEPAPAPAPSILKAKAEQGAKLKRYQALLACLER